MKINCILNKKQFLAHVKIQIAYCGLRRHLVYLSSMCTDLLARKHKNGYVGENQNSTSLEDTPYRHIDMSGIFAKNFFLVSADTRRNVVCSPLSALMPMGKLALGAEGKALDELLAAVGVNKTNQIRDRFKPLLAHLRYLPGGKLDIVSRIYVSDTTHLNRPFVEQAREAFDSSVVKLDFRYPTYVAEEINAWVASQTNYMIKDILNANDIPESTSLVLINAVYFNGRWKNPFDKVRNDTFYPLNGGRSWTPMMRRIGTYNYTASDVLSAKIIQIPYQGGKASFVAVLPTSRHGLPALLSQLKLAPELLNKEMSKMVETDVELSLPKFKIESTLNLNELYPKADIKQIFDTEDSGLTKIIRDATVHVSTARQKAFIDVHQFGTEAGGSSSIAIAKLSLQRPKKFIADHPFLFFILVKKQQLFSGILVNPLLN